MFVIYISGIDGCGKTTQAKKLAAGLHERGLKAEYQWLRWEPSVLHLIHAVRAVLAPRCRAKPSNTPRTTNHADSENHSHDRWTHFKRRLLRSSLFRRVWLFYATRDYLRAYRRAARAWRSDFIVLDRYLFDFAVDQSLNFEMNAEDFLRLIDSSVLREMGKPDLSVFIHIPPNDAWQRKQDGTSLNYLRHRAQMYRAIPASPRVLHVEGMRDVEAIQGEIARWVVERITELRP